ncbi:MAG: hypothetical protein ACI9FO_001195 [Methylophagaceae bacterium]|jgi:hypothetical protein
MSMNMLDTARFAAFIGIDWPDAKHDICIHSADGDEQELDIIVHQSYWAGEFYRQQRTKANTHQTALRALVFI